MGPRPPAPDGSAALEQRTQRALTRGGRAGELGAHVPPDEIDELRIIANYLAVHPDTPQLGLEREEGDGWRRQSGLERDEAEEWRRQPPPGRDNRDEWRAQPWPASNRGEVRGPRRVMARAAEELPGQLVLARSLLSETAAR